MIAYFGQRMIMGEELLTHGNQKLVFIAMSRKFFPAGICGLLLAAIIAASISTADSQLLVASSSFTADLYKPFFRKGASEKETLLVGRVLVLVLSLIAFAIANSKGSGAQAIMDMVENAWGAFGASFGPTILLSLFWKRFNYKGAVAGVVSGFVVDLGWLLSGLTAATGVYEIVPGFIVSWSRPISWRASPRPQTRRLLGSLRLARRGLSEAPIRPDLIAATGIFESSPVFASLVVAYVVARCTAPNAKAVEIFDKASGKDRRLILPPYLQPPPDGGAHPTQKRLTKS